MPFGGLGVVSHWTDKENETIEQGDIAEREQKNRELNKRRNNTFKQTRSKLYFITANYNFEIANVDFANALFLLVFAL